MQEAPDNRIYISTEQGTYVLTYIDRPDSDGLACNVVPHGLILPFFNSVSIPYFPNYDLGPLGNYIADAGPNDTITQGQSVVLGIPPVAGVKYQWHSDPTLSDTTVAQPIASPDTTTTYYLTITDTSTYSSCNVREDTVTVFMDIADVVHTPKPQNHGSFRVSPNPVSSCSTSFINQMMMLYLSYMMNLGIVLRLSACITTLKVECSMLVLFRMGCMNGR
ncbi:MAG: hypothetical protein H0W62_02175 [Chitinophagales bacterium]|nr:hypothetical protein [Chitinophagales bacterium]